MTRDEQTVTLVVAFPNDRKIPIVLSIDDEISASTMFGKLGNSLKLSVSLI